MFGANGNFIIKENYENQNENEIKNINKNSQLFYDAEGALRASIMISEYGDFTVSTNYGSIKQNMTFNSDGTLRTSGGRFCLDDVCLNKDDILKLKQVNLSGNPNESAVARQFAELAALRGAVKQEELDKQIENKMKKLIEIDDFEERKRELEEFLSSALEGEEDWDGEIERTKDILIAAEAELVVALATLNNSTSDEEREVNQTSYDNALESVNNAELAVEQATINKNTANREYEVRSRTNERNNQDLARARGELTEIEEKIRLLE